MFFKNMTGICFIKVFLNIIVKHIIRRIYIPFTHIMFMPNGLKCNINKDYYKTRLNSMLIPAFCWSTNFFMSIKVFTKYLFDKFKLHLFVQLL